MRIAAFVFVLCSIVPPAWSQSASQPTPGQRVWVRSVSSDGVVFGGVKGTLESLTADAVRIRPSNGGPAVSLATGPRTALFVMTGRRPSVGRGAAIGIGVGAVAGAIVGAASGGSCSGFLCFSSGDMAVIGAVMGGVAGLVGGGIVGALSPRERWAAARWVGAIRPTIAPGPRGVGLGLSVAF